jgi:hypothetical protein
MKGLLKVLKPLSQSPNLSLFSISGIESLHLSSSVLRLTSAINNLAVISNFVLFSQKGRVGLRLGVNAPQNFLPRFKKAMLEFLPQLKIQIDEMKEEKKRKPIKIIIMIMSNTKRIGRNNNNRNNNLNSSMIIIHSTQ